MLQAQQAGELDSFGHVVWLYSQGNKKGVVKSPSVDREANEAKCGSGESSHGGPQRPLCEIVKVKPEF